MKGETTTQQEEPPIYQDMIDKNYSMNEFTKAHYGKNTKAAANHVNYLVKKGYAEKQDKNGKIINISDKPKRGGAKIFIVITPAGKLHSYEQKIRLVNRDQDYVGTFLNNFADLEQYYQTVQSARQTITKIEEDTSLIEWHNQQSDATKADMINKLIQLQQFLTSHKKEFDEMLEFMNTLTSKLVESRNAITMYEIERSSQGCTITHSP